MKTAQTSISARIDTLRHAVFGRRFPSYRQCMQLAKVLFDIHGPSAETLKEIARIRKALPWPIDHYKLRLRGIHAAALGERSDWAGAIALSEQLYRRSRTGAFSVSSLAVIEQMHLFGVDRSPLGAACAAALAAAREWAPAFDALLHDTGLRIAVVGNAPTEIGQGRGHEIDGHDVVVRFNNYSDDAVFAPDYGRKTDVWVRAASHTGVWERAPSRYDFILFSGPDRRHHGAMPWDVLEVVRAGGRAVFVPTSTYIDLVAGFDHPPSAGLLFLYMLRRARGPFATGNVSVYGFSRAAPPSGLRRRYFDAAPEAPEHIERRHNWPAEAEFLQRVILQ